MQRRVLCRSRRELSNAYLLAKIGVDTAENEPCKVCLLSVYRSPRFPGIEGKWCCSAWCFTDCSCPESNTIGGDSGLFYSYAACDGAVVAFNQEDGAPPDSYDASLLVERFDIEPYSDCSAR